MKLKKSNSIHFYEILELQKNSATLAASPVFCRPFTMCASSRNDEMGLFRQCFKGEIEFSTQK